MLNIAVFCSGEGTNLQAIIDAVQAGDIKAKISLVISDKKEAPALQRAERAGIKAVFVHPVKSRTSRGAKQFNGVNSQNFSSKQEFETKLIDHLKKENIGLIVLAGFMRMLSLFFVQEYPNKILNIHPSLLPAFRGSANAIWDALNYGVKITGATVHFIDEKLDNGPIILQRAVAIEEEDNEELLRQKIQKQEHTIYPLAIKLFVEGRLKVEGRKVRINNYETHNFCIGRE